MADDANHMNNLKPIDILLAEDNDDDLEITEMAFQEADLKNHLHVVRNGQEVLDFLQHTGKFESAKKYPRPGLILLDIDMPELTGLEVLMNIKAHDDWKTIPVIMLTSSKNESDIVKSYRQGASGYIRKPMKYEDFVKVIEAFNAYWKLLVLPPR